MSCLSLLPALLVAGLQFDAPVTNRIAMTPELDGIIETEEWDHLADVERLRTYLQWEPGTLYLGSNAPSGQEVVWSLDLAGDGWLRGNDNLEVRLIPGAEAVKVRVRRLVSVDANPVWVDDPVVEGLAKVAFKDEGGRWNGELALRELDFRAIRKELNFGVRVDEGGTLPLSDEVKLRDLVSLRLAMERSFGLPSGVSWAPEMPWRTVVAGESVKLRMNFKREGDWSPTRVDMRTLGDAGQHTATHNLPFPNWDKKGRNLVDYNAQVTAGARKGYTLLLARIFGEGNEVVVVQSSYCISDPVSVEAVPFESVKDADGTTVLRGEVTVKSNSEQSLRGEVWYDVPEGWKVGRGQGAKMLIYHNRGSQRFPIVARVPAGTKGLEYVKVRVQVGKDVYSQMLPVVISE